MYKLSAGTPIYRQSPRGNSGRNCLSDVLALYQQLEQSALAAALGPDYAALDGIHCAHSFQAFRLVFIKCKLYVYVRIYTFCLSVTVSTSTERPNEGPQVPQYLD